MIQSCVRKAAHIDGNNLFKVPAAMPMLFLLELMQKLRSIPSHILIDTATHNVILDFIFHFDVNELATGTGRQHQMSRLNSNRFTQSKEYLPSICEICEEFLNSEVDRIEIALKVLSCQWEICDSLLNSAAANPPQLPELYDRMPDMIYPLLLHPKQPEQLPWGSLHRTAYLKLGPWYVFISFFIQNFIEFTKNKIDGYFARVERISLSRLSEGDAALFASATKLVPLAFSVCPDVSDIILHTLKAINRCKDSPLQLPFLLLIKQIIINNYGAPGITNTLLKR